MGAKRSEFEVRLAKRVQAVRIEKGMSLADLARVSGLSASYLSRVESGKAAITLAGLARVAAVLGVPVAALCGEAETGAAMSVFRAGSRPKVRRVRMGRQTLKYELMADAVGRKLMEPMLLRFDRRDLLPMNAHPGEEMLYAVEGEFVFSYAEKEVSLSRGDAVYFDATLPHTVRCTKGNPGLMLSVLATRDYLLHSDIFALLRT